MKHITTYNDLLDSLILDSSMIPTKWLVDLDGYNSKILCDEYNGFHYYDGDGNIVEVTEDQCRNAPIIKLYRDYWCGNEITMIIKL